MSNTTAAPDTGYTTEQIKEIQEAFRRGDFTQDISPAHKVQLSGGKALIFNKAKHFIGQYWLENLSGLGVNRQVKNFSKDYPINLLESTDSTFFSEQIAEICADPDRLDAALNRFGEMLDEPITNACEAYARSVGKDVEELNDDEICIVVDKIADVLNEEFIKVLMLGQRVPEIFEVSNDYRTHEDYNALIEENYDLINFRNQWTHCKTKLGAPLFFSELSKSEQEEVEGARNFFEEAGQQTQAEYEAIRKAFLNTLDSIDCEIFCMRERGYTLEEISQHLGYKTHSAVSKRLTKMEAQFFEFIGYIEDNTKQQ